MQKYGDNKNRHMKSVAEVMYENAGALGINPEEAYVVGLLHDVGYIAVERDSKESHGQKGAEILERMGLKGDALDAVRYHGTNCYQLIENGGLKNVSPMLVLTQYADMSVNHKGEKVGFEGRLKDIGKRYGRDSVAYINAKSTVNFLNEMLTFTYDENEKPFIKPMTGEQFIDKVCEIRDNLELEEKAEEHKGEVNHDFDDEYHVSDYYDATDDNKFLSEDTYDDFGMEY